MSRSHEPPRPSPRRTSAASHGDRATEAALALSADDFVPAAPGPDLSHRMLAWGAMVGERLRVAGLDLSVSVVHGVARPHLALSEPGGAALTLSVDAERVRAGLDVPPGRLRALRAGLSSPELALELSSALEELPEQFSVEVAGDSAAVPANLCQASALRTLVDRAEVEGRSLWIGWAVPREVALPHAALLDEQLKDALVVLASVFGLLTDHVDAAKASRPESVGHRRKQASARAEDDRDKSRPRPRSRDERREPRVKPASPSRRPADAPDDRESASAGQAPVARRPKLRSGGSRGGPAASKVETIEKGTRVRVVEGPFGGQVGTVQELDARGMARVMLGLLAVRLEVSNLAVDVEGRRRPLLSTSHRKPIPVRS